MLLRFLFFSESLIPLKDETNDNEIELKECIIPSVSSSETKTIRRAEFHIDGMSCASCVNTIESYVKNLPGVVNVSVNLLAKKGIVDYEDGVITPESIKNEISDIGFPSEIVENSKPGHAFLRVSNLSTPHDISELEQLLMNNPQLSGIKNVKFSLDKQILEITYQPEDTKLRQIIEWVNKTHKRFRLTLHHTENATEVLTRKKEIEKYRKLFFSSLFFAIPAFIISMVFMAIPPIMSLIDYPIFTLKTDKGTRHGPSYKSIYQLITLSLSLFFRCVFLSLFRSHSLSHSLNITIIYVFDCCFFRFVNVCSRHSRSILYWNAILYLIIQID
jgi:copper chaperone CopZ